MNSAILNNAEYSLLLSSGGDGLVAFFATLRDRKNGILLKPKGKEGPGAILQKTTGLSRSTIEKYFPILLELGLVQVLPNGSIFLRGRKWSRKNLPTYQNYKLIPVEICESFAETKISSYFVRVHSNIQKQKSRIGKKAERIQLLRAHREGQSKNLHDRNLAVSMVKKGLSVERLEAGYRSISTISNLGFSELYLAYSEDRKNSSSPNKSHGNYLKNKLLERGLVTQERCIKLVLPGVQSKKVIKAMNEAAFDDPSFFGAFFQGKKGICLESSPSIVLKDGSGKKQVGK